MATGTVEVISPRGRAFNAKIDGEWYGLGFSKPNIEVGQQVSFEVSMNGAFKNAKDFKVLESTVSKGASAPKSDYAKAKDDTQKAIQYQAARKAAIQVAQIAVTGGLIKLPADQKKQLDVVLALIDTLTDRYDSAVTAHVAGKDAVAAEDSTSDDEDDEELY